MTQSVDLDPDALVVRFSPASAEGVHKSAYLAQREHGGGPRVSVFADVLRDGESQEGRLQRLLQAACLSNINLDGNSNRSYWACARAGDLVQSGFGFVKDLYDGEVPEHYSVELGDAPGIDDAARFVAHFVKPRRPTP